MSGDLLRFDPTLKQLNFFKESDFLDYHLFDGINDYLNLLYAATAVFDWERDFFSDISSESPMLFFNGFIDPDDFYQKLLKLFNISVENIENALLEYELKHDRLKYLLTLKAKIEEYSKHLKKDLNGSFAHRLFIFTNNCEEDQYKSISYSQTDFQTFFSWMEFFLDKSHSFLTGLYEITEKTDQSQLPRKPSANGINASTKEDPFRFFNYLFADKGINILLKAFIPDEMEMATRDIVYDEVHQIKKIGEYDVETSSYEVYEIKFSDKLLKKLSQEYNVSLALVREMLSKEVNEDNIKLYLKKCLQKLQFLLTRVDQNGYKEKYPLTELVLHSFIVLLHNEYEVFYPTEFESLYHSSQIRHTELRSVISSSTTPPVLQAPTPPIPSSPSTSVEGFKWIRNDQDLCRILSLHLTASPEPFIDPYTNIDSIHKLFSIPGTPASAPKIQWQLMHKKQPNKKILLYLFMQLMKYDLINSVSEKSLKQKINEFFFWDVTLSEFQNLDESLSSLKKTIAETPAKKRIDQIIENLRYVMFSA